MRGIGVVVCMCAALSACNAVLDIHEFTATDDATVADELTIGFAFPTTQADELSNDLQVAVRLSRPADTTVTARYRVAGGSALIGSDYAFTEGMLTFAPGATEDSIGVQILDDGAEEDSETITLELFDVVGAATSIKTHEIDISSDILPRIAFTSGDSANSEMNDATISVALDRAAPGPVTVDLRASGSATDAIDFALGATVTFAAGETHMDVPVDVVNDVLDEDDETLVLSLENPSPGLIVGAGRTITHTIQDDDGPPSVAMATATSTGPEGQQFMVSVALSSVSGKMISVPITLSGTASPSEYALVTPTTIVFAPGQMTTNIVVDGVDDAVDELDETVTIMLGQPTNATLGGTSQHVHTLADDDPTPSVSFLDDAYSVNEGNTTINFAVNLSAASSRTVTIPFMVTNQTANGNDYNIISSSPLTIPAGQTQVLLIVEIKQDNNKEPNEKFTLILLTPTNANLGTFPTRQVTIVDDD